MRKLMWFTVGTAAGIAAGIWLFTGNLIWIIAAICLSLGLLLSFFARSAKWLRILGCVWLGCAAGLLWLFLCMQLRTVPAKAMDGRVEQQQITVTDSGSVWETGTSGQGELFFAGRKHEVFFYLTEAVELEPGDRVNGWFQLRYTGFDNENSIAYERSSGVMLTAYAQGHCTVFAGEYAFELFSAAGLRNKMKTLLYALFPEDTGAFAVALLLGDSSGLTVEADIALQNSGIRHIIAVSGLHVSMLFGVIHFLTGKRKWLSLVYGVPILFAFAAIAGFTPSVLRACIMQSVILVSYATMREYDGLTSLSISVLILLGIDPYMLASISFQLSTLCVLGIILFGDKMFQYLTALPKIRDIKPKSFLGRICRWVCMSISISVSAMLFTLPVTSYYFGIISTVSVLTNLLTLWAVNYIFCGVIVACVLGAIYVPLGSGVAFVISVLIRYVLWVAQMLSRLPYSSLGVQNTYILIWLIAAYVICIFHFLLKRKGFLLTAVCVVIPLCAALIFTGLGARTNHFQLTVLDVGQGQCLIFQSKDQCYVVDCGGDSGAKAANMAAHALKNQGINRIDGLILTHFDHDHGGGIRNLMTQIQVQRLYLPDAEPEAKLRLELEEFASSQIQWVRNTQYLSFGNAMLTLYPADYGKIRNESSMCILFQSGKYDILITGDKDQEEEKQLLRDVALPQIDILIVGHHGSASSTSMELLDAIRPSVAVISADGNYNYGHPSVQTLMKLEIYGCRVLRTDLHGNIIFRG